MIGIVSYSSVNCHCSVNYWCSDHFNFFLLRTCHFVVVQCSFFIMLCLGSIGMDCVISEPFCKVVQENDHFNPLLRDNAF